MTDIHKLAKRVEEMTVNQLLTAAINLSDKGELELAEAFAQRAADLLNLKRLVQR